MDFGDFLKDYKTIIIIILIIIIVFIVWRYVWTRHSISRDFSLSNLETTFGWYPAHNIPGMTHNLPGMTRNIPPPNISPQHIPGSQNIPGETLHRVCLTPLAQSQIADEMRNKLNEIDSCDCRSTCAQMYPTSPVISSPSIPAPSSSSPISSMAPVGQSNMGMESFCSVPSFY